MAATSEVPVTVDSAIASASPDGTKRPFSELLDAVDRASPAEAATKNAAEPGAADAKRPRQEE